MSYVSFSAASGSRSFRLTEMRNGPRLLGVLLLAAASCHFGHASSNKHYKHRGTVNTIDVSTILKTIKLKSKKNSINKLCNFVLYRILNLNLR